MRNGLRLAKARSQSEPVEIGPRASGSLFFKAEIKTQIQQTKG
jgi:hypothetical protein